MIYYFIRIYTERCDDMNILLNTDEGMLLELNEFIHGKNSLFEYHLKHITLVKKYALTLNNRLGLNISPKKLTYASLAHDLLKERSLHPDKPDFIWKQCTIPQDVNRYVRTNLDVLENFQLDEYFNSSCQFHALAAGIFLYKELNITDPEILYPVMFHSCPIVSVYETLPKKIQHMVDIIMLSDKLSSNYLRINFKGSNVRVDLDQIVFGLDGNELNYSLGLYISRLISQGKSEEEQGIIATEMYYKRLKENNPFMFENYSFKKLGGTRKWPERKSQAFRIR